LRRPGRSLAMSGGAPAPDLLCAFRVRRPRRPGPGSIRLPAQRACRRAAAVSSPPRQERSMHNGKNGVRAIPEGFHTITPHVVVRGGAAAIEFYKKAFGATEICRFPGPDGQSLMHGELKIGDSILFLADEFPNMGCQSPLALGGSPVTLSLYVEDTDAVFNQ